MFFEFSDLNEIINEYLNIEDILLFRKSYKKNIFKILKKFNYVRHIKFYKEKEISINKNDKYKIEFKIYQKLFESISIGSNNYNKLRDYLYNTNKKILNKINYLSISNFYRHNDCLIHFIKYVILKNNIFCNLKNIKCGIIVLIHLLCQYKLNNLKLELLVINMKNMPNKATNIVLMKINELFLQKNITCNKVIFYNYSPYFKKKFVEAQSIEKYFDVNTTFLFS